jgi:biopolymer transport protein ExbB
VIDQFWTTYDYLRQGGWVMVPIGVASVLMWVMILERMNTFRRLGGKDIEAIDALRALEGQPFPDRGRGLRRKLLEGFLSARTGTANIDRVVLKHVTERNRRFLRGKLAFIAVLAGVAPLLGLLGTVLGMIQTFEVISIFGTSNAKAMAGGISVALITTQSGLVVAIPGLFISGGLARRSRRLESALDEFSLALDRKLKSYGEPALMEVGTV